MIFVDLFILVSGCLVLGTLYATVFGELFRVISGSRGNELAQALLADATGEDIPVEGKLERLVAVLRDPACPDEARAFCASLLAQAGAEIVTKEEIEKVIESTNGAVLASTIALARRLRIEINREIVEHKLEELKEDDLLTRSAMRKYLERI